MILTITPSPAIDWTVRVPAFELGAVNRATDSSREASGKGLNVSWALHRAGLATHAIFPGGGATARFMAEQLDAASLSHTLVANDAEVRTNISLVVDDRSGTKVNEPGSPLGAAAMRSLLDVVSERATASTLVVTCGSLPPGAPIDMHGRIAARAAAAGVDAIVDASGDALEAALSARPALIKPNVHELSQLAGRRLDTIGEVIDAARATIERGPRAVLVSLGGDGAVHVDRERAVHAIAADVDVVNAVGAGDALLAGFVAADGDVERRLRGAVLWASSAVGCATTLFPVRHELADGIAVRTVDDLEAPLTEPGRAELA